MITVKVLLKNNKILEFMNFVFFNVCVFSNLWYHNLNFTKISKVLAPIINMYMANQNKLKNLIKCILYFFSETYNLENNCLLLVKKIQKIRKYSPCYDSYPFSQIFFFKNIQKNPCKPFHYYFLTYQNLMKITFW